MNLLNDRKPTNTERAELIRKLREASEHLPFDGAVYVGQVAKLCKQAAALLEAAAQPVAWHHPECEGACIACLIEQSVLKDYGNQGLSYLRKRVGAHGIKEQT